MKKIPLIAAAVLGLILAAMAVSQQRHHSDEMSTSNQENADPWSPPADLWISAPGPATQGPDP